MSEIVIPASLLPRDGRFGCGPSKVRDAALNHLSEAGHLLGTSHRKAPVKDLVAHIQERLVALLGVPDGYQVVLGNGGASQFWDIACCCLIEHRSSHAVFGEFSSKFAAAAAATPYIYAPRIAEAPVGSAVLPGTSPDCDVYAWPQNETSTGACAPVRRLEDSGALMLVDATSAAGGMPIDIAQTDVYYFSPQKNLAADGGLWIAVCSPAALERSARLTASDRWIPASLDLTLAAENSAKNQTVNTPAIATLILIAEQLDWLSEQGGLEFAAGRAQANSDQLYTWAETSSVAAPFVSDPQFRSPVVATIDFDEAVDAARLCSILRANGIVDIEPYRKLNRNQIRVGCFPAVDPSDIAALIACIDWTLERLV